MAGVHGSLSSMIRPWGHSASDRFVQVEEHAGHGGPGGQLGRVDRSAADGASPVLSNCCGRRRVGGVLAAMLLVADRPATVSSCAARFADRACRKAQRSRSAVVGSALRPGSGAQAPAPPRRRSGRSAAPAPAAACSIAVARRCTPRASARRTPAGWGAGTSGANRCTGRGDTGPRRDRSRIRAPGNSGATSSRAAGTA